MRISKLLLSTSVFVLLCSALVSCVKAEAAMWNQSYSQSEYFGRGFSMVEDSDGGYVLAGALGYMSPEYSADCWLVKTDADGNMTWNQTYEGVGADWAYSLVNTSDGGYALAGAWNCSSELFFAGYYDTTPIVGGDFWLLKTDSLGNMEWNKTYGEPGGEIAYSLVNAPDGGYALAGIKYGSDNDAWLVKTDADGNMEWNQTYGGKYFDYAYSLVATYDGGYALAGAYYNGSGLNGHDDFWLVKADSLGNIEWNMTYGGEGHDEAHSLLEAYEGGYVIAGHTNSFGAGHADYWLIKTDANGNVEWHKTYGGEGVDYANALIATSDNGYAILGTYGFPAHEVWVAHHNFWLVKTNETGVVPEISSWLIPTLLLATTAIIAIYKKKYMMGSRGFAHGSSGGIN